MGTAHDPDSQTQKELASLVVTVAGRSAALITPSVLEPAMKLKKSVDRLGEHRPGRSGNSPVAGTSDSSR